MDEISVYFDLDGVVADAIGGIALVLGLDPDEMHARWPRGVYWYDEGFATILGHFALAVRLRLAAIERGIPRESLKTVNDLVSRLPQSWWEELDVLPWARTLLEHLPAAIARKVGARDVRVSVLTSASAIPAAAAGKTAWCAKHFPDLHVAIARDKSIAARPNAWLVDDHAGNVDAFVAAGGRAVLFPAPWNGRHADYDAIRRLDIAVIAALAGVP